MAKSDISIYTDEHVRWAVVQGLERQDVEATHAAEVGMLGKDDDTEHLPYAASIGAVLFTLDKPFAGRASQRDDHAGVVCWTGSQTDVGGMIRALVEFAETHTPEDVRGRVFWLKG